MAKQNKKKIFSNNTNSKAIPTKTYNITLSFLKFTDMK